MPATTATADELQPAMNPLLHPVTRVGALRFKLPPYAEILDQFDDASAGDLSMTIHGPYRSGKTTLMKYLIRHFAETSGMVVFHCFQASGSEVRKSSALGMPRLARELRTSRSNTPLRAGSEVEALIRVIQTEAERLGTNRILLLIDEAQYLSLEQLIGLKALLETLIDLELIPFVVLFAQPEVMALRKRLLAANQGNLVDRFFLNMHRLRGHTRDEIDGVLRQFDERRWPEEGGMTYTQFFMPLAWGQGLRLAAHAPKFRRAFTNVCVEFKRDADDIPIKYIIHAASRFLRRGEQVLARGADLQELIEDCVRRSGILESFAQGNMERIAHTGPARLKKLAA
jgi:hypothetical protein